jgi:hypothetical protein
MPRHETGKLHKRLLRDRYWAGSGPRIWRFDRGERAAERREGISRG